jgi:hypothetical protein
MPSSNLEFHHVSWAPEQMVGLCHTCHRSVIHGARANAREVADEITLWLPSDVPASGRGKRVAKASAYYAANRDKINAKQRAYDAKHRDEIHAKARTKVKL